MTQSKLVFVNESHVSFASVSFLIFPAKVNDLRACQNDCEN
jgi:hypothetical protein